MRKIERLLLLIATAVVMTGCVSTEKIVYFQGSEDVFSQAQKIIQQYEMRLKPADQIMVKVTCKDPELLTVFRQDVVMGTSGTSSSSLNMGGSTTMSNAYAYTVTNDGYVTLPAVGKVKVEGLTVDEASVVIEDAIRTTNNIKEPEVTVLLLNARVAVLGAVHGPRVVTLSSERNTILDVLAQCGDVDDTGLRQKLKLYREVNGERMMYDIDLTKADIFNSPAFYVQQNDLIYVEPNKSKSIKSSSFYTFLGAGSSIIGLIASITSLVLVIAK